MSSEVKSIKFVKKARMWCLSYWIALRNKDIQKQEWFPTFETAKQKADELNQLKLDDKAHS